MTIDAQETQDEAFRISGLPVTVLHALALLLCALGLMLDTLEIALGTALGAVFSAPGQSVPATPLSLLLGAVYVGAMFGAPVLGWAADRFGRRRILMGVLVWIGITSLIASVCRDIVELSILRALCGVALGAYPPIMIAFLTDLLPAARRGMLILLASALAMLGPPLAILLVRWLTLWQPMGFEAWRWAFIAGGTAAVTIGAAFALLPESPAWLLAKGRLIDARSVAEAFMRSRIILASPVRVTAATSAGIQNTGGPRESRPWPFVGGLYLLSPWATVAFPLLAGAVLMQKGFKLTDSLLYVGLSSFGPLLGTLLAATSIDRLDRRLSLSLCATAMLGSGLAFFLGAHPLGLVLTGALFGLFSALYVPTLGVYSAELFPTHRRASATAAAWALNRLGAAIAPLVLLPLLRNAGALAMFAVMATALLLSVAVLTFAPRGRQLATVA